MVSFDFLSRYACRTLGVECVEFEEVKSQYRGWVPETDGQYAFTHPHKAVAARHPLEAIAREVLPEPVKVRLQDAVQATRIALSQKPKFARPQPKAASDSRVAAKSDAAKSDAA